MKIRALKSLLKLKFKSRKTPINEITFLLKTGLNFTIHKGPFKGMKYIDKSSGSVLLPKITGTYECELHEIINKISKTDYSLLIDIGAAEGYYAVGFAYLNKANSNFRVLAYDVDQKAKENLKELATLNNLHDSIEINDLFQLKELQKFSSEKIIIICDIEGGEKDLLNPEEEPLLLKCDILVEIHDGNDSNEIKNILKQRFDSTHNIKHIIFDENHVFRKKYLGWIKNRKAMGIIANEGRKYGLDWFYIVKKN